MKTIVIVNLVILILLDCIVTGIGLDIKKWTSWLYGLGGFVSSFLTGLNYGDFRDSLILGLLGGFVIMFSGVTSHWHRNTWGKKE